MFNHCCKFCTKNIEFKSTGIEGFRKQNYCSIKQFPYFSVYIDIKWTPMDASHFFFSFPQVSFRVTVRLNTILLAVLSGSTQK